MTAGLFAALALEACAPLVAGPLGPRLAGLLLEQPRVHAHCPRLVGDLRRAMERWGEAAGARKGFDMISGGSGRAAHIGPLLRSGPSDEQPRTTSNRERCRDLLFGLVRDACGLLTQQLSGEGLGRLVGELRRGGGALLIRGGGGGGGGGHSNTSTGVAVAQHRAQQQVDALLSLRARAQSLVCELHPANLGFMGDVVASCIMQAAATGEALMEAAVASLAQLNPARFQRLSQRMQAQGPGLATQLARGASAAGPHHAHTQRHASTVSRGGGSSAAMPPPGRSGGGGGSAEDCDGRGGGGGSYPGSSGNGGGGGGGGKEVYATCERLASALELMSEFPPVQQPYALLLELSDSRSLCVAVQASASERLRTLLAALDDRTHSNSSSAAGTAGVAAAAAAVGAAAPGASPRHAGDSGCSVDEALPSSGPPSGGATCAPPTNGLLGTVPLGEQAIAMSTLALYLGYFSFCAPRTPRTHTHATTMTPPHAPTGGSCGHGADTGGGGGGGRAAAALPLAWSAPTTMPALDVPALVAAAEGRELSLLLPLLPPLSAFLWFLHRGGPAVSEDMRLRAAAVRLLRLRSHPALRHPGGGISDNGGGCGTSSGAGDGGAVTGGGGKGGVGRGGGASGAGSEGVAGEAETLGLAALCARCMLDDLHARLGPLLELDGNCDDDEADVSIDGAAPAAGTRIGVGDSAAPTSNAQRSAAATTTTTRGDGSSAASAGGTTLTFSAAAAADGGAAAPAAASNANASGAASTASTTATTAANNTASSRGLSAYDALVDPRFFELACPLLGDTTRLLERAVATQQQHRHHAHVQSERRGGSGVGSAGSGGAGAFGTGGDASLPAAAATTVAPRKLSVVPVPTTGQLLGTYQAAAEPPPSLAALLRPPGAGDPLVQQLLAQYSTDDQPVKMRDVLVYVADSLAAKAYAAAAGPAVLPVARAAVAGLPLDAACVMRDRERARGGGGGDSGSSRARAAPSSLLSLSPEGERAVGSGEGPSCPGGTRPLGGVEEGREEGQGGAATPSSSGGGGGGAVPKSSTDTVSTDTAAEEEAEVLERCARDALVAAAAAAAPRATAAALDAAARALSLAIDPIGVAAALRALLPESVPLAAVSAAAVLACDSALAAAATRMLSAVPAEVRAQLAGALRSPEVLARAAMVVYVALREAEKRKEEEREQGHAGADAGAAGESERGGSGGGGGGGGLGDWGGAGGMVGPATSPSRMVGGPPLAQPQLARTLSGWPAAGVAAVAAVQAYAPAAPPAPSPAAHRSALLRCVARAAAAPHDDALLYRLLDDLSASAGTEPANSDDDQDDELDDVAATCAVPFPDYGPNSGDPQAVDFQSQQLWSVAARVSAALLARVAAGGVVTLPLLEAGVCRLMELAGQREAVAAAAAGVDAVDAGAAQLQQAWQQQQQAQVAAGVARAIACIGAALLSQSVAVVCVSYGLRLLPELQQQQQLQLHPQPEGAGGGGDAGAGSGCSSGGAASSCLLMQLPQRVLAYARDHNDLAIMGAVRLALQRATFSSVGIDTARGR
ncbi:hypothetical protein FOA52_004644 [Chlamydomonas sp. UWO 241]|nr:hypothetical protein FOA52_004644 [Chlamydomonas sp. UWO 241]